jgi:hypothetical protein
LFANGQGAAWTNRAQGGARREDLRREGEGRRGQEGHKAMGDASAGAKAKADAAVPGIDAGADAEAGGAAK